jgi:hypothetical protein
MRFINTNFHYLEFKIKPMKIKFLALLLILANFTFAQTDSICNCCSESYNQFDFLAGDWNVYDSSEVWMGSNHIVKMQDNCILQENWSSNTLSGTSYNYFDASDSLWHQLWLDNQGGNLKLSGQFVGGKMIMRSANIPGENGLFYNEITWSVINKNTILQEWNVKNEQDQVLTQLFMGFYKRRKP